jgi:hypothetical protein
VAGAKTLRRAHHGHRVEQRVSWPRDREHNAVFEGP